MFLSLTFKTTHHQNLSMITKSSLALDIKKVPGLDSINNKLIQYLKPALLKFLHFFFNLCISFGIHPANWKIAKVIMLHKAGKREDLAGSYRPLSLTSCLAKLLEKAVADNLNN